MIKKEGVVWRKKFYTYHNYVQKGGQKRAEKFKEAKPSCTAAKLVTAEA
jgi:hypothetical protein